ncbi:hypothetical protein SCAR479_06923 [Seiridium cardinale]|uniref:Uncharacterized protein n=1 Tax=Seiridium cardinale TaxID=138064 RepID=A0ABR2XR72_9PEZI
MTTWITTHGIGAIKDSKSTFEITVENGSGVVRPTTATDLRGWVHFTIPGPPVDKPVLKIAQIDFSSQSASVETMQLYLANRRVFDEGQLQKTSSFDLDISSSKAIYQDKGIALSLELVFNNVGGALRFQSVGIQV